MRTLTSNSPPMARVRQEQIRAAQRKKKLLIASGLLLLLLLGILSIPVAIQRGTTAWLAYEAHHSDVQITFRRIRARFLRPVEIEDLRIVRAGIRGPHFELIAPRVQVGLKLRAFLRQSQASHLLRSLRVEHAKMFLRGRAPHTSAAVDWNALAGILPDRFELSADEIILDQQLNRLEVHDASISGSKDGSGTLFVGAMGVRAPFLQRNFADLRGVTRWADDRLTIGSFRLQDGLTIDSLSLDLTRLRASRVATELSASVFGGAIRVNLATERAEQTRLWDGAATASGISLPQLAAALGLKEPVLGSLHASKFTFRGDPRDFLHGSASLWIELTGFSWRERQADVIMCGATFYNRIVQLQQAYIKQRSNELTLSGETTLGSGWLNPDFRGDIAATINDLGQFAELAGQPADAFRGKLGIRGRVHAHERTIDGDLVVTGDALEIFDLPVDILTARVNIDSTVVELSELELKRGDDFVRSAGQLDLRNNQPFIVSLECHLAKANQYALPFIDQVEGEFAAKLDASGDAAAGKGTLTGQVAGLSCFANGYWQNKSVVFDTLSFANAEAKAEFRGTINLSNSRDLRAEFSAASPLLLEPLSDGNPCLRGLQIHRGDAGVPFAKTTIASGTIAFSDAASNQNVLTADFCRGDDAGVPLQINVPSSTTPPPTP